jgi:hypothetical protein
MKSAYWKNKKYQNKKKRRKKACFLSFIQQTCTSVIITDIGVTALNKREKTEELEMTFILMIDTA